MRKSAFFASLPVVAVVLIVATGCDTAASRRAEDEARQQEAYASREIRQPKETAAPDDIQEGLDIIEQAYDRTQRHVGWIGGPQQSAIAKIGQAIEANLELGPTLVVWLVDRTPSAEGHVGPALEAAKALYDAGPLRQSAGDDALLTAIVAFDEQAEFLVDPPTSDLQAARKGFDAIRPATSGREMIFTALQQSLDKYLDFRTRERRQLLFVIITDEAGEDPQLVEKLIPVVRRQAIPVYVVGVPAPWGQTSPFAEQPRAADAATDDDSLPRVGPESLFSERVDIEGWSPRSASAPELDLVDSGFGPFALEWLCRESRGKFFALRPEVNEYGYAAGGIRFRTWPPGGELRFDESVVGKYAPDYGSKADYEKLLAENKARQALHQAAQMPTLEIEGSPETRFPKAAEAQMARVLSRAQQFSATHAPLVDRLYEVLAAGERDRERLSGARWQAQYDLAMGRVLAMKARLDGYNSMIAALKRGRTFKNENSIVWILEPADAYETESTIRRLAERAKTYLQRVVDEHPGTPWAKIAEEELKPPMGWTWREE